MKYLYKNTAVKNHEEIWQKVIKRKVAIMASFYMIFSDEDDEEFGASNPMDPSTAEDLEQ